MTNDGLRGFVEKLVSNVPKDWLQLTTHRLDIYNEDRAKTQFIEELDALYTSGDVDMARLEALPTAYDYIRLGHPLSCVLEWVLASGHGQDAESVISFSSMVMPVLAVLRKNLLDGKSTQIAHTHEMPKGFDAEILHSVYGYTFEMVRVEGVEEVPAFDGTSIFVTEGKDLMDFPKSSGIDFIVEWSPGLGSVIMVCNKEHLPYISEIQHVRRRESIAMTPTNCIRVLNQWLGTEEDREDVQNRREDEVLHEISKITGSDTRAVIGSSGLSIQYAIVMGLIHHALEKHPGQSIKLVVPPNCYGGTNDQARRVAACLDRVEVVDLPVDGDHDMADSVDKVLHDLAKINAIPLIIVEIPTNPRVEVPNLAQLTEALSRQRYTANGEKAIEPIFILDQTFCPNVQFLTEDHMLSSVRTISYVSGSKFPSGGLCTAGYALSNKKAKDLMQKIDLHLNLCDNAATDLQVNILARQMPSMLQRIQDAYLNTREFVRYINKELPEAKINFISDDLVQQGFTPSVFSLDLPTTGQTPQAREEYKRALNHKLIKMMISEIPLESKHCVSYGQLKGCYWTIPATSTQGTTKEEDKDYIARVACSPNMSLEKHKEVFRKFVIHTRQTN